MINLNMINLNSSNIINEQLSECYEQLPDISIYIKREEKRL